MGDVSTDLGFSVLETHEAAEPEVVEKFRTTFAFDEKETLLGCELLFFGLFEYLRSYPARFPRLSLQTSSDVRKAIHLE